MTWPLCKRSVIQRSLPGVPVKTLGSVDFFPSSFMPWLGFLFKSSGSSIQVAFLKVSVIPVSGHLERHALRPLTKPYTDHCDTYSIRSWDCLALHTLMPHGKGRQADIKSSRNSPKVWQLVITQYLVGAWWQMAMSMKPPQGRVGLIDGSGQGYLY